MKFNYKRGSKTPKGKPAVTRVICKDHTIYPIFFDERGVKRSEEEVKKIFEGLNKTTEILSNKQKD